ncbi:MAG: PIG-L family deacetylase [Clostridia bacterium]|nr:PIG-L family deacetylase [Clostridia bacterium]MBQ7296619.1 PIG-L family deacetylase [Clostridia bacterium]
MKIKETIRKRNNSLKFVATKKVAEAATAAADLLCAPPDLSKCKKVLFVQPHPDDNEIAAGGTMAWLRSIGVEVYELTVTDDRYADPKYIGKENNVQTTRQKEALAAQRALDVKNAGFLGFADKNDNSVREISLKIMEVIRRIQPDFVITADPNLATECHSDHIKVGMAVKYACMDAECNFYPEFIDGKVRDDAWKVGGIGFYYTDKPNTIIDITEFEELKMKSIKCHKSQAEIGLLASVMLLNQVHAEGTPFKAAEPLRLQSGLHMHCFNLPIE